MCWCRPPRAATARPARRDAEHPHDRQIRCGWQGATRRCWRCAAGYMRRDDFERLNERPAAQPGGKDFVNLRNTAAGAVRQLDPKSTAQRPLSSSPTASGGRRAGTLPPTAQRPCSTRSPAFGLPVCADRAVVPRRRAGGVPCRASARERARCRSTSTAWSARSNALALQQQRRLRQDPRAALGGGAQVSGAGGGRRRGGASTSRSAAPAAHAGGLAWSRCSSAARRSPQTPRCNNEDETRRKTMRVGDTVIVRRAG